jgi:hypothetical protein
MQKNCGYGVSMIRRERFFIATSAVLFLVALGYSVWLKHKRKVAQMTPLPYHLKLEDQVLDVRIFFGYKDARPARFVGDRYEQALFLQRLTAPCSDDRFDCGFARDQFDGPFLKTLQLESGRRVQVSVRVFGSSVGVDDDVNRGNPFQKWRSDFTKNQFAEALKKADVVFYNGHSRAGGGPDFAPPELTKFKHVRYGEYQRKKPGFHLVQNILKSNPNSPLRLIGLYSCESDQLFKKKIEAAKPKLRVIGSRQLLYFSDAFNDSLDQLSQILEALKPS